MTEKAEASLIDKLNAWAINETSGNDISSNKTPVSSTTVNAYSNANESDNITSLPLLRRSIINEILLQLPTMIGEVINNNYSLCTPNAQVTNANTTFCEQVETDIKSLKKFKHDTTEKFAGYQEQVQAWCGVVKNVKGKVDLLENQKKVWDENIKKQEKSIINKTKEYNRTEKQMKELLK